MVETKLQNDWKQEKRNLQNLLKNLSPVAVKGKSETCHFLPTLHTWTSLIFKSVRAEFQDQSTTISSLTIQCWPSESGLHRSMEGLTSERQSHTHTQKKLDWSLLNCMLTSTSGRMSLEQMKQNYSTDFSGKSQQLNVHRKKKKTRSF